MMVKIPLQILKGCRAKRGGVVKYKNKTMKAKRGGVVKELKIKN
jgi:hypothetical protein